MIKLWENKQQKYLLKNIDIIFFFFGKVFVFLKKKKQFRWNQFTFKKCKDQQCRKVTENSKNTFSQSYKYHFFMEAASF